MVLATPDSMGWLIATGSSDPLIDIWLANLTGGSVPIAAGRPAAVEPLKNAESGYQLISKD